MKAWKKFVARVGALGAAVAMAAAARAQNRRIEYPVAPLRVTDRQGEIVFRYDYYGEKQTRDDSTVEYSNHFFQEYVKYRVDGYSYHPRFLDFSTELKLGLSQMRLRKKANPGQDEKETSFDVLEGYDLRFNFFKEHPVSLSLFARRDEEPILGLFTDRYLLETESRGGVIRWKNDYVPMELGYTRTESEETGTDSHSRSVSDLVQYSARHNIGEFMRSNLRYRYLNYRQEFRAENPLIDIERETELDSHDVNFTNSIYFSNDKRSNLTSLARYFRQRGDQQLDSYAIQERLRLQHNDALSSYYQASFLRNELANSTTDTYSVESGLDHRLFRSLFSHIDVHGRRTEFDPITEDRYGVTGSLTYRKETALGRLTAGAAVTLDKIERSGGTGSAQVLNETFVMTSGFNNFLDQSGVIPTSIAVTDQSELITYVEGFDFEVFEVGGRTGLRWLPGGNLSEGQVVLVDYRHDVDAGLDYVSEDRQFNIRHDFDRYLRGVSLYYRYHEVLAHSVNDELNRRILEYDDHVFGAQYKWKWLTWTEEYEKYDSNFGGYDQLRSQIEGNHRLPRGMSAGWNAGVVITEYEDEIPGEEDERSRFFYVGSRLGGPIRSNGYWSLEARAQQEDGRTERTTAGLLGRLGWRVRKLSVEAGARYEYYEIFESERDRFHFFIKLSRTFR